MNDRETNDKKAKDWDVLELYYKMDRVEEPKLHASKLVNDQGSMDGEDIVPGSQVGRRYPLNIYEIWSNFFTVKFSHL